MIKYIKNLVSIIMPTYNCEQFLADAIESVVKQTYLQWELILVDDCSTDKTRTIAAEYQQRYPNIYVYCMECNSGAARTRNKALSMVKGEYVAFLDGDDIWDVEKLEKQLAFMKRHKCAICATAYRRIDESGNSLHQARIPDRCIGYWKCYFKSNPIGNSTVVYHRAQIGEQQVPEIKKRNDFALWLQLLRQEKYILGMPDILTSYRVRNGSLSSKKLSLMKYHWELYHRIEKHGILISVLGIVSWAIVKGTGIGLQIRKCD